MTRNIKNIVLALAIIFLVYISWRSGVLSWVQAHKNITQIIINIVLALTTIVLAYISWRAKEDTKKLVQKQIFLMTKQLIPPLLDKEMSVYFRNFIVKTCQRRFIGGDNLKYKETIFNGEIQDTTDEDRMEENYNGSMDKLVLKEGHKYATVQRRIYWDNERFTNNLNIIKNDFIKPNQDNMMPSAVEFNNKLNTFVMLYKKIYNKQEKYLKKERSIRQFNIYPSCFSYSLKAPKNTIPQKEIENKCRKKIEKDMKKLAKIGSELIALVI